MQIKGKVSNIKEFVSSKGKSAGQCFYSADFQSSDDATCEMQVRLTGSVLRDLSEGTYMLDLASVGMRTREWGANVSVGLEAKVRSATPA